MVDLAATSPFEDLLPVTSGTTTLTGPTPDFITSFMPFGGKEQQFAAALIKAHGLKLPAAGRSASKSGLRMIWAGRGRYFLSGDKPASRTLARAAALVDQSDGWVVARLEGVGSTDVMARLTPIDLRAQVFRRGHVALTELTHVSVIILGIPKGFDIMVPRSFAPTAVEKLRDAMDTITAQTTL